MKKYNICLAAKTIFNHKINQKEIKKLPYDLIPNTVEESYQIQDAH